MPFSLNDIDDSDPRAATISAMVSDVGWCLMGYGRVEYLFGDLVWRAREMPEYAEVAEKQFPMSLGGRLRILNAMLELPGPLSPYQEDLRLLMGRMGALSDPRNMFVHGHTSFHYTPRGDAAVLFRTFLNPTKATPASKYEGQVRPASLATAKFAWTLFAATAQDAFRQIYSDLRLEGDPVA